MKPTRSLYVAEPPMAYAARPALVVDNSLLCAIFFKEPENAVAQARLAGHSLHAPALLDHEVANVALMKHRKGLSAKVGQSVLQAYRDYAIQLHDIDFQDHYDLGRRYGLTAYDAAYLWLAAKLQAPLATFDHQLNEAAQAHFNDAR